VHAYTHIHAQAQRQVWHGPHWQVWHGSHWPLLGSWRSSKAAYSHTCAPVLTHTHTYTYTHKHAQAQKQVWFAPYRPPLGNWRSSEAACSNAPVLTHTYTHTNTHRHRSRCGSHRTGHHWAAGGRQRMLVPMLLCSHTHTHKHAHKHTQAQPMLLCSHTHTHKHTHKHTGTEAGVARTVPATIGQLAVVRGCLFHCSCAHTNTHTHIHIHSYTHRHRSRCGSHRTGHHWAAGGCEWLQRNFVSGRGDVSVH